MLSDIWGLEGACTTIICVNNQNDTGTHSIHTLKWVVFSGCNKEHSVNSNTCKQKLVLVTSRIDYVVGDTIYKRCIWLDSYGMIQCVTNKLVWRWNMSIEYWSRKENASTGKDMLQTHPCMIQRSYLRCQYAEWHQIMLMSPLSVKTCALQQYCHASIWNGLPNSF